MKATLHGFASLVAGMGRRMTLRGSQNQSIRAMTLTEVVVVIALVMFLIMMLAPFPHRARRTGRIQCVHNLEEIGLSYKIWSGDNNDKLPFQVSVTNGGAMESVATGNVVILYQCMSNELSTPKILVCRSDADHSPATNFLADFSARNLSYFAGLDADDSQPQAVLSGDANLIVNGRPVPAGILNLAASPAAWTKSRHGATGNVGLADGSVQSYINQMGFVSAPGTIFSTNRVVIP